MLDRARGLLFDLDGTLVDSAPAIARALSDLRERRGAARLAPATVRRLVSLGAETLVAKGLGEFAGDPVADLVEFRAMLRSQPPTEVAFPGVMEALEAAAHAGLRMAVVTNKPYALSIDVLSHLGLLSFLRGVVGGDSTPALKPDHAPMKAGLAALRLRAHEIVYIGDSAVDALAARAIGAPFLLFEAGYAPDECPPELVDGRLESFSVLAADIRSRGPGAVP